VVGQRRAILDLSAVLGLTAGGVYATGVVGLEPLSSPATLPWWVFAVLFAVSDAAAVHIEVRREMRAISLAEVFLVLGLFLCDPVLLVPARVLGGLVTALVRRRQVVRTLLDTAQAALSASVAVVVFRAVAGSESSGPRTWVAALAAALAAEGVAGVASLAAQSDARGPGSRWRALSWAIAVTALVAGFEGTLGLLAVVTLEADVRAGWLLGVVAAVVLLAYRGYGGLGERHANLERLYTFSRAVEDIRDASDATQALLLHTRDLLQAAGAEVALRDESGDGSFLRVWLDDDGSISSYYVEALDAEGWPWPDVCASGECRLVPHDTRDPVARAVLRRYEARELLIAPLLRDGDIAGTIAVTSRRGDARTFGNEDRRFFEALATHASVALENERLITRLRQEAMHDALTGLGNRAYFRHRVADAIAIAGGREQHIAVMIMDVDRFKEVNDTLGHHNGDILLQDIGQRLTSSLGARATIARLGGDEFALLAPFILDELDAVQTADLVQSALERPFVIDALNLDVRASIGVAIYPQHGTDPDALLQRADVAMYAAKGGTRSVEVYAGERDQYSPRRLALIGELRRAIEDDELTLHYQPKAALRTGVVKGVEALLRWQHPKHGLLSPDEFVPLAEHTDLIRGLTQWVLRHALQQCAAWQHAGLELTVAVNVSVRNLLDPDLSDEIARLLDRTGVPASMLVLEITESSVMSDPARTIGVLQRLAGMGIGVSVDDFGTGYSSLSYLSRLPVDEIKIDKSFVQGMLRDRNDSVIVETIVDLGASLGLRVVAEGVEDAATWDRLADLGCAMAQGYHLSRPIAATALTKWLAERPPPTGSDGEGEGAVPRRIRRVV